MSQQIETQIDVTLTERNRLSALFRIILVVPMVIYLSAFSPINLSNLETDYLAIGFLVVPVALSLVVRQIYPSYLLAFNEAFLSLSTRVDAYIFLLSDEYPSIEENDIVSVTFPPLVKWFLAIPLYIVGIFYAIYAFFFLTLFAWFSILFTGIYPERCAEGVVGTIAFWNRTLGYSILLVTDEYPSFSL